MSEADTAPRRVTIKNGKGAGKGGEPIPHNRIRTSKYTCLNFVPKNTFEQLHKFGNCYFLLISAVMYIGEKTPLFVGTIKGASTLLTLLVMMSFTALVALLDDRRRAAADKETNAQKVTKIDASGKGGRNISKDITWADVQVGDILEIKQDDELPADIVPLYCSGDEGTAYVSTANLDGETNLKQKAAPSSTQTKLSNFTDKQEQLSRLGSLNGAVEAEAPSADILNFSGSLKIQGQSADPLTMKQLLLRGTKLRNTERCVGIVVYTGTQTRMVMNSRPAPLKQSNLERVTNMAMVVILIAQASLALLTDVLFIVSKGDYADYWYLYPPDVWLPDWIAYWLTFFVLYSNLMPISLYPTMEVCNLAQAYFIKHDKKMYDQEYDFHAGVRSSNLCQELGQVSYIFSDKTGTLTKNVMELKRLSIGGRKYGDLIQGFIGFSGGEDIKQARQGGDKSIDDFLEVLAVCHTVVAQKQDDGSRKLEAESPDELALVEAVSDHCDWKFQGRVGNVYRVQTPSGQVNEYEIVAINAFDSTRKRMSILVRTDSGYHLFAKGADNVMLEIGAKSGGATMALQNDLDEFARSGLRTLVVARRQVDQSEVGPWRQRFDQASNLTSGREEQLAKVAAEIENGLQLVGATAIEDKLQDEVPETIVKIRQAGIKLWVLTGDKLETAREIGFSTKVLTHQMEILTLQLGDSGHEGVQPDLDDIECKVKQSQKVCGMMVTGAAVKVIQESEQMKEQFLWVASQCSVLIACRVSPAQKAAMVRLVREGIAKTGAVAPVTLAVGDGANDVPMIQEAQVGVGIFGREGRQAVNNSDFSIGQFRFLQRLLLVHGRWNYRRACKFTLFTFWRNMVSVLLMFYYTFISGYSGTSLFEDWIRMSFNFLCSFPIMATGVFDKDVPDTVALAVPRLYKIGRLGQDLNAWKTAQSLFAAFVHSMVLLLVLALALPAMDLAGAGDYYTFGTAVFSCMLVDMNYRVAFLTVTWNKYTVGAVLLSFLLYGWWLFIYPSVQFFADLLEPNMYSVPAHMAGNWIFWFCIIAVPAIVMMIDLFGNYVYNVMSHDPVEQALKAAKKGTNNRLLQSPVSGEETDAYTYYSESDYQPDGPSAMACEWEGDEESDEDDECYPEDLDTSAFAQQTLPYLAFRVQRSLVLKASVCNGVLLLLFGIIALSYSQSAAQLRITYAGHDSGAWWWPRDPAGTQADETLSQCHEVPGPTAGASGSCDFSVTVPRTMKAPIHIYYSLGPFYQNYYDYLKSEVIDELEGDDPSSVEAKRQSKCVLPTREFNATAGGETTAIRPCGMKATSVFNDSFSIVGVEIRKTGIAWNSDVDRYANPEGYPENPQPTSWLYQRYPGSISEAEGVDNHHFAAWMRPAAIPYVTNPYGFIDSDLTAGQKLEFKVELNFPTESLDAYKQLVLTEITPLGGRSDGFGILLICCGVASFVIAIVVMFLPQLGHNPSRSDEESSGDDSGTTSKVCSGCEDSDD